MRLPFVTMLAVATLQTVAPASAQAYGRRYPVCMDLFGPGTWGGGGGHFDYAFTSQ